MSSHRYIPLIVTIQAAIFEEVFRPVELTPVDYGRLMEDADRRVVLEGEHLSEAGRVQEDVFLIVEGTAEVKPTFFADGVLVSTSPQYLEARLITRARALRVTGRK